MLIAAVPPSQFVASEGSPYATAGAVHSLPARDFDGLQIIIVDPSTGKVTIRDVASESEVAANSATDPKTTPDAPKATADQKSAPQDACANDDGSPSLFAIINRPDASDSTCTVTPHAFLAEFGYGNEIVHDGMSRNVSYPQGFLRYGINSRLEFDILGPETAVQRNGSNLQRGWCDSGIGLKLQTGSIGNVHLAVGGSLTLPSGSSAFTNGAPTEVLNFDASSDITPSMSWGTTLGLASQPGQQLDGTTARYAALQPAFVVDHNLGEKAQVYFEAFGVTRIRPDGGSLFGIDGGFQYLLSPRFEIDVEGQSTVTDVAHAHALGAGFGILLY